MTNPKININIDVKNRKFVDPVEVAVGILDVNKNKEDTENIEISAFVFY